MERAVARACDLNDARAAPADLAHRVLRDGVLLIERDRSARIAFEVARRNEYFDLLPYLLEYRRRGAQWPTRVSPTRLAPAFIAVRESAGSLRIAAGDIMIAGRDGIAGTPGWNIWEDHSVTDWQKLGGIAALGEAAAFVFGFALFVSLLGSSDYGNLNTDAAEHVKFLADHEALLYLWNFVIYVVFGIVLVPLACALLNVLKTSSPMLAQTAAVFGFIWAGLVIASGMIANIGAGVVVDLIAVDPDRAAATWLSIHSVVEGIGGGNEIVGGVWVILVSSAARAGKIFPEWLNFLGISIGGAGVLTAIPALGEALGAVFGLGLIAWFSWLGVVLLRRDRQAGHTSAA